MPATPSDRRSSISTASAATPAEPEPEQAMPTQFAGTQFEETQPTHLVGFLPALHQGGPLRGHQHRGEVVSPAHG